VVVILICGLSVWPAYHAIGAEVSSLDLRAKYLYNVDAGDLRGKTGFVYFGLSAVGLLISWYMVKETKDLSQEEIDRLYEKATNDGSTTA
jgi:hypothetical protein